ncbi:uncharacterized protein BDW70DRAFT_165182 [Aspergillus foveolatus]|uniref:uncharacterized protein n=1 Tax=Aspergillus foveolatus TaxID=210207 RepID=UPI003CCDE802
MVQVRSQMDYAPFRCCFRCGMPQSVCLGWQAGQQCPWRGAMIPTIAGMLYGPHRAAVESAWQRHLAGRMVEQRVVFPQKAQRQEIHPHPVDVQDVASVAAFLGQATTDGQGVEMQAAFCWLRRNRSRFVAESLQAASCTMKLIDKASAARERHANLARQSRARQLSYKPVVQASRTTQSTSQSHNPVAQPSRTTQSHKPVVSASSVLSTIDCTMLDAGVESHDPHCGTRTVGSGRTVASKLVCTCSVHLSITTSRQKQSARA